MEILKIYDKYSDLNCHGKNIFETTSSYLDRFPSEYRICYDYNTKDINLFKVDDNAATYVPDTNAIIFVK